MKEAVAAVAGAMKELGIARGTPAPRSLSLEPSPRMTIAR